MRRSNNISSCRLILLAVFALLLTACSSGGQVMDGEDMVRSYTQISQDEARKMMEQDDEMNRIHGVDKQRRYEHW